LRGLRALVVLGAVVASTLPAAAQTWVEITPAAGDAPTGRRYAGAIHDPVGHRMIVFGGETAAGRINEVWALDLNTYAWTDLTPAAGSAPGNRRTPGTVYDPAAHRMVTWSGQGGGFFNDAWSFDLTSHSWTQHTPATTPQQRYGVAAVFDPLAGTLVTFAGFTNLGRFDDTWRFDPVTETWTDVSGGTGPHERCLHSASYDSRDHRMIMYGGQQSGPLDDIWAFDLSGGTWTDLTPATRPAGRFFTTHVYDALNHRSTIFGGTRGAGLGVTNEVWLFDLTTNGWTLMTPSGTPPSAREGAMGVYIESEDRMVVFGGHDGGYLDDIWSLNGLSQTATAANPSLADARLLLRQNEPNPFNPSTTIRFELPRDGHVTLDVFDVAGRRVASLLDGPRPAGTGSVTWNGRDVQGEPVSSGVYLYRLRQGELQSQRKMLLVE
jgi:hypothetical protein